MKNQRSESEEGFNVDRFVGFLLGFLSGGLIGVVAALLLAPRSGKKTRSQVEKKGKKLRRQAAQGMEGAVADAGNKVQQFADGVKHEVGGLQHQAQELIAEAKK